MGAKGTRTIDVPLTTRTLLVGLLLLLLLPPSPCSGFTGTNANRRTTTIPINRRSPSSYYPFFFPRRHASTCLYTKSSLTLSSSNNNTPSSSLPALEKRRLNREFLTIAIPALIQFTAEPLAALVDTAYLGRLGASVLGGAGVAVSAHYSIAKLYNDPLLRTTISLVATAQAQHEENDDDNPLSQAVSSALLLALIVGVAQMLLFALLSRHIIATMGVTSSSGKDALYYTSALGYLRVRAYGTPAATLWLVTQGIFRGLGDTTTPLVYSLLFTLLNAILDPLFIFTWGWGASGAAAGTTLAQYIALVPLLYALERRVPFVRGFFRKKNSGGVLRQYLQAGTKVLIRTLAKVSAYAVCARYAALLGAVSAAAYNLTFQVGFAVTQVCESIAIAVQTLLAREMNRKTPKTIESNNEGAVVGASSSSPFKCRHLIRLAVTSGGTVAILLSGLTWFRRDALLRSLTTDVSIQKAAASIFPMVLLTQVAKGLAYPVNGIIMGGQDWTYSMIVMWMANAVCLGLLTLFAKNNVGNTVTLGQLWWALAAFMSTQVVFGVLRYSSRTGPWKVLRDPPPVAATN